MAFIFAQHQVKSPAPALDSVTGLLAREKVATR